MHDAANRQGFFQPFVPANRHTNPSNEENKKWLRIAKTLSMVFVLHASFHSPFAHITREGEQAVARHQSKVTNPASLARSIIAADTEQKAHVAIGPGRFRWHAHIQETV